MESNSVNDFCRGPPKEYSCQVWSKLAQRFGRRRCLKKLLMSHDGHLTTLQAPLEHVVLRWAKKSLDLCTYTLCASLTHPFYQYIGFSHFGQMDFRRMSRWLTFCFKLGLSTADCQCNLGSLEICIFAELTGIRCLVGKYSVLSSQIGGLLSYYSNNQIYRKKGGPILPTSHSHLDHFSPNENPSSKKWNLLKQMAVNTNRGYLTDLKGFISCWYLSSQFFRTIKYQSHFEILSMSPIFSWWKIIIIMISDGVPILWVSQILSKLQVF